ncbi:TPA: hypothetical protein HA235_02665 [Candidatus Woesearchaeota archaeon]|nr:hypothetical protein [Candidatus Woesearchaeota archaeon]HIH55278.1 hypothetical protein [Candidatus Woesearchaeota archaeon]HIJ02427.1 hypothetical protein [Candidatus Woesearchaeota archaeon]HIJ13298.1 hypothetical protein [Candidatus Woesearchaeota archaeon]
MKDNIITADECNEWMKECLLVFPELKRKKLKISYKKISPKTLGYVSANIEKKLDFDPEALLLGEETQIKEKKSRPKDYAIFINDKLQRIANIALRKELVQNIIIHELLHVNNDDLFTLSKGYDRRKKKKIHVNGFDNDVFTRYNQLRGIKGIMKIEKKEHLDIAVHKILETIRWND